MSEEIKRQEAKVKRLERKLSKMNEWVPAAIRAEVYAYYAKQVEILEGMQAARVGAAAEEGE
jgi:hypothetical protein